MSPIQFSPAQARFLYLFKGFAPVATNIVTPMMVAYRLREAPLSRDKRQEIIMQEVARQLVSGCIGLLFYFGGGALTRKLLERTLRHVGKGMGEAGKQIAMTVGATAAEFLGYGFVRPLVSTDLIVHWLQRKPLTASPDSIPRRNPPALAVRGFQTFLDNRETPSGDTFRTTV